MTNAKYRHFFTWLTRLEPVLVLGSNWGALLTPVQFVSENLWAMLFLYFCFTLLLSLLVRPIMMYLVVFPLAFKILLLEITLMWSILRGERRVDSLLRTSYFRIGAVCFANVPRFRDFNFFSFIVNYFLGLCVEFSCFNLDKKLLELVDCFDDYNLLKTFPILAPV